MAMRARRLPKGRHVDPKAVSVPADYRVEVAATGLNNPSSVDFDPDGNIFIAEMGSPDGSAYLRGRVISIHPDGSTGIIADDFAGSLTALTYYEGAFYVAEHAHNGRIFRLFEDGSRQVLADDLPGGGDHPTSDIVVAHSERFYFAQGTRTNSGVVGPDNLWLTDHPELADIPGEDVVLSGRNFESDDPFAGGRAVTGPFKLFGVACRKSETIAGDMKCSGGIMRADPEGEEFDVFAWGFRRPLGLSVHADGRIFCSDVGMKPQGSRPIPDGRGYLWQVVELGWYGWPDYSGDELVDEPVLAEHPPLAGKPVATLPIGSEIAKFDFSRSPLFGSDDVAYAALLGEPGKFDAGSKVVMIDILTGKVTDFMTNRHPGPASEHRSGGIERPITVKFDRTGEVMYVLDLGILDTSSPIPRTLANSGVLWRIVPQIYIRLGADLLKTA